MICCPKCGSRNVLKKTKKKKQKKKKKKKHGITATHPSFMERNQVWQLRGSYIIMGAYYVNNLKLFDVNY